MEEKYKQSEGELREVLDWHKSKIKQILQVIVDREKCEKKKLISHEDESAVLYKAGYNQAKQDTIDYLNNEIKRLSPQNID